eukprot:m.43717 g.43717  ORF g.43717 m.43717 type:complete len:167 (+) comp10814_c0_seq2:1082-1582(+)
MSARKPVEVVVFNDPTKKNSGVRTIDPSRMRKRPAVDETDERKAEEQEFKLSLDMINDLGASALTGREKKAYEREKMKKLGYNLGRNQKMPYNMLMAQKKREKEREIKEREMLRMQGELVKKPSKASEKQDTKPGKRWMDNSTVEDRRIRGGVMNLAAGLSRKRRG